MAEKRQVIIEVDVEDNNLDQSIGEINTQLKDNRKELKELNKDYEKNATEISKLERANKDLSASKRELIRQYNIQEGSLNSLRNELIDLIEERNRINLTTKEGAKEAKELNKQIKNTSDAIKEQEEAGGDFRRNVGNYKDAFKRARESVKGFGLALKALGLGLIVALVAKFTEALSKNRVVADAFKVAVEAIDIVLSDLINFLVNNSGQVVEFFKNIFEDPLGNIQALGDSIKQNLIGRFDSLINGSKLLAKTFKQLFEGDFKGALETAQDAALELGDAVLLIQPSKVIEGVTELSKVVADYSSKVLDTAKSNVELANSAELVEARNKALFESYDQQAEKLRQVRDEERNSIDDRIKANNELSEVLEKQQKLQLEQQDIAIRSAQIQFNKNKGLEEEKILLEALAEKNAILADIEGRRSEQLINDLGLKREQDELEQTLIESINQRALRDREFEASRIVNDEVRRQAQLDNLDFEAEIESQRLYAVLDSTNIGTQARQDAEQAILDFGQDIAQRRIALEKQVNFSKIGFAQQSLGLIAEIAGENTKIAKAAASIQAGINVAQGITAALGSAPPPYNFILAGLTGAAGAIQIAKINSESTSVSTGGGGSSVGFSSPSPSVSTGSGLANVNASLLGQFGQSAQQTENTASTFNQAAENTNIQVSVVDINEAQDSRQVKVNEASL